MKILKGLLFSLLVFATCFSGDVFAASYIPEGNGEYAITKYDINIVVNENNTFNIAENIGAYFNVGKHGIFRKIPMKNKVIRLDGTTSYNYAKVSNIIVSDQYTLSNSNNNKVIKIGDADNILTGAKDYQISYLYNIGKDLSKDYDELYFNIIGNEWDTTISGITFTITMPKDFDKSKLGFSSGDFGSTENKNVEYNVNGNIITGSYFGTLKAGESLSVRLELPEGYFVGASSNFDLMIILAMIIPILFVFIALILWKKYGKDNKAIETVEFYPPNGLNSAEVGLFYKGKATKTDVISLLIYLADKGYIKISETEQSVLDPGKTGFKITILKDYDGDNVNEKVFLNGLFNSKVDMEFTKMLANSKNPEFAGLNDINYTLISVTEDDLYNSFYVTIDDILNDLNSKENKQKMFEKNSLKKGIFIILMIIITFIIITAKPVLELGGELFLALIFPGIGFTVMFSIGIGNTNIYKRVFALIFGLLFGGVSWVGLVLPALRANPLYLLTYIMGLICIMVMIIINKHMTKRNSYGNEMLGKIKGFKNFLETAEKPKLEELVMENPSYFYNILPYTYVLGISDKWIEKFETIALQAPNWFDSDSGFNMITFNSFMNSTMRSATSIMPSISSSDFGGSGGSGSGGGSSGGGSGGGGGGSW